MPYSPPNLPVSFTTGISAPQENKAHTIVQFLLCIIGVQYVFKEYISQQKMKAETTIDNNLFRFKHKKVVVCLPARGQANRQMWLGKPVCPHPE